MRVTAVQLLRILGRRWYVLLLVAVITAVSILLIHRVPGVYWTQVDVVFLPPKSANALEDQNIDSHGSNGINVGFLATR